jgi:amidophosphoribosyltransferase
LSQEITENCGLFGVFGCRDAVERTYWGLYALQHRGQESAGMATTDGESIVSHRGMGLVVEVFNEEILNRLSNPVAVGHVRYSTTGSSTILNAQPIVISYAQGQLAVAHNGNLVNALELRYRYERKGSIFQTTNDSEILGHLMAHPSRAGKKDGLEKCLRDLKGSFSLILLTPDEMIGVRDSHGWRPLCLGRVKGGGWVLSSESCALTPAGAEFVRELQPGEVLRISRHGLKSSLFCAKSAIRPKHCIFEHIYFARPSSVIFGDVVHEVRKRLGARLAEAYPADADLVISVPDSGNSAAIGYEERSNLPQDRGFIRNHYVGRTFIQPFQVAREKAVRIKLDVVKSVVRGKRVIVVEDSIVRGTTVRQIIRYLWAAGPKEVHLRVTCPPIISPCFYGINFPTRKELLASHNSPEEIRLYLNLTSLGYLPLKDMLSCVSNPPSHYCTSCFTGRYPVRTAEMAECLRHECAGSK